VVPMQDLLGLGADARMNKPGTAGGNWRWRMRAGAFNSEIVSRLKEYAETYDRAPR
jgi:4-alpha-glucanotransferase